MAIISLLVSTLKFSIAGFPGNVEKILAGEIPVGGPPLPVTTTNYTLVYDIPNDGEYIIYNQIGAQMAAGIPIYHKQQFQIIGRL